MLTKLEISGESESLQTKNYSIFIVGANKKPSATFVRMKFHPKIDVSVSFDYYY